MTTIRDTKQGEMIACQKDKSFLKNKFKKLINKQGKLPVVKYK